MKLDHLFKDPTTTFKVLIFGLFTGTYTAMCGEAIFASFGLFVTAVWLFNEFYLPPHFGYDN